MAQRRMTSLDVIDTDVFLDMGQGAQLLYFHLNARADDDGFVANPKKVLRSIGGNDDDLRLLVAKKFLIAFEDGVCVIKHWRINNFVRKDIYQETKYLDHKQSLFIRANGAYTLTEDGRAVKTPLGHYTLESVNDTLTKRQLSIGKVSTNSGSEEPQERRIVSEEPDTEPRVKGTPKYPNARTVFSWFPKPQQSWRINTAELKYSEMLFKRGEENVKMVLKFVIENSDDVFCPKVTKPSDLERKWQDIIAYKKNNGL